mmetsp:Transcript_2611/g.6597  ORF Transcript_2611/g.6597 Transcript_2611/m.6597 type:complete len:318 (-) Transcript_2611:156-1109(-)
MAPPIQSQPKHHRTRAPTRQRQTLRRIKQQQRHGSNSHSVVRMMMMKPRTILLVVVLLVVIGYVLLAGYFVYSHHHQNVGGSNHHPSSSLPSQQQQQQQHHRVEEIHKNHQDRILFTVDPAAASTAAFLLTTAANSWAALCKDRAYAQLFGNHPNGNATALRVPRMSYGLWLCRDLTVIGSSFVLPPMVAKYMDTVVLGSNNGDPTTPPSPQSLAAAQFLTPLTAQLVAGPLHYLGLDYATRPNCTLPQRWASLRANLSSVISARMVRILPGYGVAGVWNQQGRQAWKEQVRTTTSQRQGVGASVSWWPNHNKNNMV